MDCRDYDEEEYDESCRLVAELEAVQVLEPALEDGHSGEKGNGARPSYPQY
jgi:hypothetical protein